MPTTHPIPEHARQAYLFLLERVFVMVRAFSRGTHRFSDDQLFDLMDAVHNIPEFLSERNDFFTDETLRKIYLEPYDRKWATTYFSLIKTLDEALTPHNPHTPPPPPTRRRTLSSLLHRLWPRRPAP